jgi:hypothetical protein
MRQVVSVNQGVRSARSFDLNVAEGIHPTIDTIFKFGRNADVGTTEEVIWDGGGDYSFLDNAEYIDIVSDDSDDTDQGAGAWTLIMYGLDSDFNEISEVITLNGTTPVRSQNQYLRLFRAIILTGGTTTAVGGTNQGAISFTSVVTSKLQAKISENEGQTLMAVYTVPAGKTAYITGGLFSVGQGKDCLFRGKFRNCSEPNCPFSNKFSIELYENALQPEFKVPLKIPEKTDMVVTGQNGVQSVPASASWGMYLIDNET